MKALFITTDDLRRKSIIGGNADRDWETQEGGPQTKQGYLTSRHIFFIHKQRLNTPL